MNWQEVWEQIVRESLPQFWANVAQMQELDEKIEKKREATKEI